MARLRRRVRPVTALGPARERASDTSFSSVFVTLDGMFVCTSFKMSSYLNPAKSETAREHER